MWSRLSDVCMTAGVLKTSFVSEIKRSSIESRHANIIWPHQDRGDHHFSVRWSQDVTVQGAGGGVTRTERKGPVETTKLQAGLQYRTLSNWLMQSILRGSWMACTYAEGRQAPRRSIQIINDFLSTVYILWNSMWYRDLPNSSTFLDVHPLIRLRKILPISVYNRYLSSYTN